ncbi:diguanylate cyclase [Lysobacter olei]
MNRGMLAWALLVLALPATAADVRVTAKALEAQPEFPAAYDGMSYPERVEWLQRQLASTNDPVRRYRLVSERAIEHYVNGENAKVVSDCTLAAPEKFDLRYRVACANVDDSDLARQVRVLMEVHADAISAGNVDVAAQVLSAAAWAQSSMGDISAAFQTYGQALQLAEKARPATLIDVTLNTATLYVMHGDREYVQKGVALQEEAIARFRALKAQHPEEAAFYDSVTTLTQYNAGVAYALHLHDYEQALRWFGQMDPRNQELRQSALVFSALSAVELDRNAQARQWLRQSYGARTSTEVDTAYLACYQQLVKLKLDGQADLAPCRNLSPQTPLEVSHDIYKRLAELPQPDWRLVGLEGLHRLYVGTLEPQLKQSSVRAASRAELNRLQLESKLKDQLLEKELALKRAEQEKLATQRLLAAAAVAILLLVLLLIVLRLRQNRKLARLFLSMSIHDGLTGLHNRRYFEHNIEREINLVKRSRLDGAGHSIAICLFDIDHFKRINDTYGHEVGDQVLVEFARRIKAATRDSDMLVRWGGEEFLLVARVVHAGEPHRIADRINAVVASQPFVLPGDVSLNVTCTIGAVTYPRVEGREEVDISWHRLVQLADAALYMGKRKWRNCWVCVDAIDDIEALDRIVAQDLEASQREGLIMLSDSKSTSEVAILAVPA